MGHNYLKKYWQILDISTIYISRFKTFNNGLGSKKNIKSVKIQSTAFEIYGFLLSPIINHIILTIC
jgi:hypothetical protein